MVTQVQFATYFELLMDKARWVSYPNTVEYGFCIHLSLNKVNDTPPSVCCNSSLHIPKQYADIYKQTVLSFSGCLASLASFPGSPPCVHVYCVTFDPHEDSSCGSKVTQ